MVVAMIGAGIFNPVMSGLVLDASAAEHSGLAAGINDAFRQTGIAVGVAALGALLPAEAVFSGMDPHAYVAGLDKALWVSAAIGHGRRGDRRADRPKPPSSRRRDRDRLGM